MRSREIAFVALVALLIIGALQADRSAPRTPSPDSAGAGPVLSTAWYCPAPGSDEETTTVLTTANVSGEPVHLRRFAIGGRQPAFREAELGPRRASVVALPDLGARESGGVVEAFGGSTESEALVLVGGMGVGSSRCFTQPSDRWFFAAGSTARSQDTYLLVANPFDEEATLTVRLLTPDGPVDLPRLTDLPVGRTTQRSMFLSELYEELESFGIEVRVGRGRLVVSRLMRITSPAGRRGVILTSGADRPRLAWQFGGGEVPRDGDELIVIVNPDDRQSLVQVIFQTDNEQVAPPSLEEVVVPPGSQASVKVADHLPRGTRHGTSVASANGVPVVAERRTVGVLADGRGADGVLGAPGPSKRLVVSAGSPVGGTSLLAIANDSTEASEVGVTLLTEKGEARPQQLQSVAVPAGRLVTVDLTPFLGGRPAVLLIEATVGIAAERHLSLGDPFQDFADEVAQPLVFRGQTP